MPQAHSGAHARRSLPGPDRTPHRCFHENQLAYPVREDDPRDHHFGFTQLVSSLAADRVAFNSAYNRDSFLRLGGDLLARMPDAVAPGWIDGIAQRSLVLPVPVRFPKVEEVTFGAASETPADPERAAGPILLWNHRWEHDKDPEAFFAAVDALAEGGTPFRLIVCGESYRNAPPVFAAARERHAGRILHWGHAPTRGEYEALLRRAHVAVSTSRQEFFGVALLEAAWCGAYPLAPDRLAYPEVLPAEHLYQDRLPTGPDSLVQRLERLCRGFVAGAQCLRADRRAALRRFHADTVLPRFESELRGLVRVVRGSRAVRDPPEGGGPGPAR